MGDVLIVDTETYPNLFSIGFRRVSDGKTVTMFRQPDGTMDTARMTALMKNNTIVTYNGLNFDLPIITLAGEGASCGVIKDAADRIITGGVKYWQVENVLGISIPRLDHIDLMEPQPNAFASLKTLQGRLHGRKMQDLPYPPDHVLSDKERDEVLAYMENDLEATCNLYRALEPDLQLRDQLSAKYRRDFRSKSDAQIGEAIIRLRAEEHLNRRIYKRDTVGGEAFNYMPPDYLKFRNPELQEIVARLKDTTFRTDSKGKANLPDWLDGRKITIGETTYAIGIGGLHSTEANRAVHADDDHELIDFDVASYYPAIILNSGLYPQAIGPIFLEIYDGIRKERLHAKRSLQEHGGQLSKSEIAALKVVDKGGKIQLNGAFGKLGSIYSVLYAPDLLLYVTITGQLSLLMLIDAAEREGIPVVSANTDGAVFRCPKHLKERLYEITKAWEKATGFALEDTHYRSLYNSSVNAYVAVKTDGTAKCKGPIANPWREGDTRSQLMKNPQMTVVSNAVVDLMTKGTPIEETIRNCRDIRDFVTVVNVKGGGVWGEPVIVEKFFDEKLMPDNTVLPSGYQDVMVDLANSQYLGKVVRYYWSTSGQPIFYVSAHPSTGNFKKVSKSDGCRPIMDLPNDMADLPADLDYDRYIQAATEALQDYGYYEKPKPVKPIRLTKKSALLWWALAA